MNKVTGDPKNKQFQEIKELQKIPKVTKIRKGDKVRIWGLEPRPNKDRG